MCAPARVARARTEPLLLRAAPGGRVDGTTRMSGSGHVAGTERWDGALGRSEEDASPSWTTGLERRRGPHGLAGGEESSWSSREKVLGRTRFMSTRWKEGFGFDSPSGFTEGDFLLSQCPCGFSWGLPHSLSLIIGLMGAENVPGSE